MRITHHPLSRCVPSMNIDLEVRVLWKGGRADPSEPLGGNRESVAESSGSETCGATNSKRIEGGNDRASEHAIAKLFAT